MGRQGGQGGGRHHRSVGMRSLGALLASAAVVLAACSGGGAGAGVGGVQATTAPAEPLAPADGSCAPPAHPRSDCVGVPAGQGLHELAVDGDGNLVVDQPNTVLNGVHVAGNLMVKAPGVVIKDSVIDGTVYNNVDGVVGAYTISDSTVGPAQGCIGQPGLNDSNYTAERVHVRGHDDGFRMSGAGNVTVRDSFAQLCYLPPAAAPPDGSHSDGIQAYCPDGPCPNLQFEHNTLDARGIPATFMINLDEPNVAGTVRVVDNLLAGGAYTIVTKAHQAPTWQVRDNKVVDGAWAYGPQSAEGTCTRQSWVGNQIVTVDADYRITRVVEPLSCMG